MSTCTPLEHDYIGLTEVSSIPPMTSPKLPSPPSLDIKETELRLGLPGSHFLGKKTHHLPPSAFGLGSEDTLLGISLNPGRNPTSGAKRGFFDVIDGCYAKGSGGGGVGGVVKAPGCVPKAVRKDIVVAREEGSESVLEKKKKEDQVSEHGSAAPASK